MVFSKHFGCAGIFLLNVCDLILDRKAGCVKVGDFSFSGSVCKNTTREFSGQIVFIVSRDIIQT